MSDSFSSRTPQFAWRGAWWEKNGNSENGALDLSQPLIYRGRARRFPSLGLQLLLGTLLRFFWVTSDHP